MTSTPSTLTSSTYRAGQRVKVTVHGREYKATVVRALRHVGLVYVRADGAVIDFCVRASRLSLLND